MFLAFPIPMMGKEGSSAVVAQQIPYLGGVSLKQKSKILVILPRVLNSPTSLVKPPNIDTVFQRVHPMPTIFSLGSEQEAQAFAQ